MDLELKKTLIENCEKIFGVANCADLANSVNHLRALKTARGASMMHRSRLILKTMGYSGPESEVAIKKLLKT